MQPIDFGTFEHPVEFLLQKQQLKIGRQHLDRLGGQFLAAFDVLNVIGSMVRHIVPLEYELLARGRRLTRRKILGNAEHLLESPCVIRRRRQKIFDDLMVAAWRHIDVLHISGHLTI